MTGKLREFVYLDEVSLDNCLSSLGEGVPEDMLKESGSETSSTGGLTAKIPYVNIGGRAERNYSNSSNLQTKIALSSPYRFQTLKTKIEDNNINVYTNEDDLDALSRGDVLELSGTITTMSLFKLEIAIKAILSLMDEDTQGAMDAIQDEEDTIVSENESEEMRMLSMLVEKFTGDKIPLRMEINGYPIGLELDRASVRMNPARVFLDPHEYTLFGRVEHVLRSDRETWDPVDATNILDRYLSEERVGEEFRSEISVAADQLQIPMNEEDMLITGPGAVVHPIGIYW